jgi:hypothetical protein
MSFITNAGMNESWREKARAKAFLTLEIEGLEAKYGKGCLEVMDIATREEVIKTLVRKAQIKAI